MLTTWLKALRVNQWTKNAVVFAAYLFALADSSQAAMVRGWRPLVLTVAMAGTFSLVSSAFYLLNDISDFEADRLHPVKRNRPVAAGLISKIDAVRAALAAFAAGMLFPCYLVLAHPDRTWGFAVVLFYAMLQCAYSGFLKRLPYVDVAVIAAGFVLRAVAGAAAMDVRISPWLLGCAFMLALFLALCKRRHEMEMARSSREALRRYDARLLEALIWFSAAGTMAVYLLYTLSADTVQRFGTRALAWTAPFVGLGLGRYLMLAHRKCDVGRPEKILLTDWLLWLIMAGYGAAAVAATGLEKIWR